MKIGQQILMKDKMPAGNRGLNPMLAEVLSSAFVLLFGFGAKLNIYPSNPALCRALHFKSYFDAITLSS